MDGNNSYEIYKKKKIALSNMLKSGAEAIKNLNMLKQVESLNVLSKKVQSETFKIMVVGQFKNGKSTFINSFLGEEVLPAYATPCTAVINELKYEKNKKAVLFFRKPLPEKLPSGLPQKVLAHINSHSGNIPPIDIPYDEIEDYAVIPMGKDPKESLLESPYEKIELYWPLDILQNDVEIIDSPGLNENETRTKVTLEYLSNADAVLFLISSLSPCAKTEMEFIEVNLHGSGFDDIYYIFNRFDQLQSDREKARIKDFGIRTLKGKTSLGEKGIFFISAWDALNGKINNSNELLEKSGIIDFEKSLSDFLTNQRGKIKLSQPSRELKRILSEVLFTTIPQQKSMLNKDISIIEKKYADSKPRLDNLQVKKRQMSDRITFSIDNMMIQFVECIKEHFREISKNIPLWLDEIEPQYKFNAFKPKESSENIITEMLEEVQKKIEENQISWQNKILTPLVTSRVKEMLFSIESNIENFFIEIDSIKVNIAGTNGTKVEGAKEVSVFERVGAAALGFFAGDIGSAAIGGTFGFNKTFFKQLGLQIGAIFAMVLFGITNPITMLPVIIGIAVFGFFKGKSGIINELKGKIAQATVDKLNADAEKSIQETADAIKKEINKLGDGIIGALDNEITTVKAQVESIIRDLKAGEAKVGERLKEIQKCENMLIKINEELDSFILGLLENN